MTDDVKADDAKADDARANDRDHRPEPSFGPDEEGETPLKEEAIPRHDRAAWVHARKDRKTAT